MKAFAQLISTLDESNKTSEKTRSLVAYFGNTADEDRIYGLALLLGKRGKRTVNTTLLRTWAAEAAQIPLWLFEETYHTVGDLAETIALLLPPPVAQEPQSLRSYLVQMAQLDKASEADKKAFILACWQELDYTERFVFNKLITGGFRIGVSEGLVQKALAQVSGLSAETLAHRLMGDWEPSTLDFAQLLDPEASDSEPSKPYPFLLAHPLEGGAESLEGPISDWQAEWKWDGIRGQLIKRAGQVFIWSRGVELMAGKFPELESGQEDLPDGTVIDGEIICLDEQGLPLPFNHLQTRIGRKSLSAKILKEHPVSFIAYDMLEEGGRDIRALPLRERRAKLESLISMQSHPRLSISKTLVFETPEQLTAFRANARDHRAEGLMLKHLDSPYTAGRKRGLWWKWKVDPLSIDAVMIYAQKGHGRRANLYTDFTFAVRDGESLVPFTKAYSGLTDKEMAQVDAFVKKNTLERFGPVRSVKAELVFEIGFEGIQASPRHKSGIALRFPRILRWRTDKTANEADTLDTLKALLLYHGQNA